MTYRKPSDESIQLAIDFYKPIDTDVQWAEWEIRQALDTGDIERANELIELKNHTNDIWM